VNRLPRGRTYARSGAVGAVSLDVGRITALKKAFVQANHAEPSTTPCREKDEIRNLVRQES
jgi:uncharacterized Zn finger protein